MLQEIRDLRDLLVKSVSSVEGQVFLALDKPRCDVLPMFEEGCVDYWVGKQSLTLDTSNRVFLVPSCIV